jgi:hypothetical protein
MSANAAVTADARRGLREWHRWLEDAPQLLGIAVSW